jgi:hypothetical protein
MVSPFLFRRIILNVSSNTNFFSVTEEYILSEKVGKRTKELLAVIHFTFLNEEKIRAVL